jgi:hypothetical protein
MPPDATSRLAVLDPRNWGDIARAYRYLVAAGWRIFVRRERVDQWPSVARASTAGETASAAEASRVARAARWTNTAARYPLPWARCLQRSLALCLWLERMGLEPVLRLGVRKAAHGIDAHAWVEYKGRVVNDSALVEDAFVTLTRKEGTPNR